MSLAVVSTLWMQIYSPEGILNTLLANVGIDTQPFIHSADQALPSIAIMSVWQGVGYQMIIFLGGLQNINPALYEAAEMDHASGWQKFKDITLPELKPLCIFVFITVTIGAFRMLVQPMVMTGGGPDHSTYTIVYDIYETGTVNWEMGLASTMAIVFTTQKSKNELTGSWWPYCLCSPSSSSSRSSGCWPTPLNRMRPSPRT